MAVMEPRRSDEKRRSSKASTYSGGGVDYRKQQQTNTRTKQRWANDSRSRRERKRQRIASRIMAYGMAGQQCWFITVVNGYCLDTGIRANIWHPVRTLLRHTYPNAAACTILEWGQNGRGIHLHVIIIGIPDFSPDWMEHAVSRAWPGAQCHCVPVYDPVPLAQYAAKQLADQTITQGWPRYTRPFTKTANWPVPPDLQRTAKRTRQNSLAGSRDADDCGAMSEDTKEPQLRDLGGDEPHDRGDDEQQSANELTLRGRPK